MIHAGFFLAAIAATVIAVAVWVHEAERRERDRIRSNQRIIRELRRQQP